MIRLTRRVWWMAAAYKDFTSFPEEARRRCLRALTVAAEGDMAEIAKPMRGLGSGVFEIALRFRGDAYRIVYAGAIWRCGLGRARVSEEVHPRYQDSETRDRFSKGAIEAIDGGLL
jgi:hypothetical protein